MTDWKALALAQGWQISVEEIDKLLPVLETLDEILKPVFRELPHNAMPWTGPA